MNFKKGQKVKISSEAVGSKFISSAGIIKFNKSKNPLFPGADEVEVIVEHKLGHKCISSINRKHITLIGE